MVTNCKNIMVTVSNENMCIDVDANNVKATSTHYTFCIVTIWVANS